MKQFDTSRKWERRTWCASAALLLAAGLGACSGEEIVIVTSSGVRLSAEDIDRNPLGLMPAGSVGVFSLDAPSLFQSSVGGRLLTLMKTRLPLPPSAGFVPERDLERVLLGLYSFQGVDFMGVASGHFDPEAIEAAAKGKHTTPLGTPLVRVEYAGRVFYVSANMGFVVLTSRTVLFGNETGIRRALDRLERGQVAVELPPDLETLLTNPGAPIAFGSDARYDPQVAAITSQLSFLKDVSLLRAVGNFDPPGIQLAGTLTYVDPESAERGRAWLGELQQSVAVLGILAAVVGLGQPIRQLDAKVVESSLQAQLALDGETTTHLLDAFARLVTGGGA